MLLAGTISKSSIPIVRDEGVFVSTGSGKLIVLDNKTLVSTIKTGRLPRFEYVSCKRINLEEYASGKRIILEGELCVSTETPPPKL